MQRMLNELVPNTSGMPAKDASPMRHNLELECACKVLRL